MLFKPHVRGLCHQLIAGCTASLSAFATATVFSWTNPILPKLLGPDSEIPMTSEEASWIVAMPEIGNLFSPIPAGIVADHFGRKIIILYSGPVFFIAWTIILYFKTISALIIARFVQGIAMGFVYTVLPMYLGEIADPRFRGIIVSIFFLSMWSGNIFEYVIGPKLSFTNFTFVTALINIVFFLTFMWQPESPYYYLLKNDIFRAGNSLSWFLCTSEEETIAELANRKHYLEQDRTKNVKWTDLLVNPIIRKSMIIMILVGFLKTYNGLWSIIMYSTETLTNAGDNSFLSPDNATIAMGVMMLIGSFVGLLTLDSVGRTKLLLLSCLTSGISTFCVGTFFLVKTYSDLDLSFINWVPPVGLIIFSGTSVMGIFPVYTAYQSELFDTSTRAKASSIFSLFSTFISFFPIKFYLTIANAFGDFVNFYIFAFVCFFGAILSCTIMPETKGKSFEQITEELKKR